MKTYFLPLLLICLSMTGSAQIKKGRSAPDIKLPDTAGNQISMSSLKGKVVLIDFWASWCTPCRNNNPKLAETYKKFHDQGFEIYSVSIDEEVTSWKFAIEQDQMEWVQVNDIRGWDAAAALSYEINAIPASFLLDKQGVIQIVNPQHRQLESEIKSLLKK